MPMLPYGPSYTAPPQMPGQQQSMSFQGPPSIPVLHPMPSHTYGPDRSGQQQGRNYSGAPSLPIFRPVAMRPVAYRK
ncbi:hypothetical protein CSKR_106330 [Clonorchis sinensis]|uniref:Uncharacterized protein n=1 Tax=Clonorchis sinensis TaxID=79923 RepID=A0A8T1LZ65_CLOSI|nr:hypothetical protein CSKR_106330 [Clonorchis sinensis]